MWRKPARSCDEDCGLEERVDRRWRAEGTEEGLCCNKSGITCEMHRNANIARMPNIAYAIIARLALSSDSYDMQESFQEPRSTSPSFEASKTNGRITTPCQERPSVAILGHRRETVFLCPIVSICQRRWGSGLPRGSPQEAPQQEFLDR